MKKSLILQAFIESPWAILPNKLAVLEEIVLRHVSGEKLDAEEVQARIHGATRPPERQVNKVAILPLFGTIVPRANMLTDVSGATSAERFGAQFDMLVADPQVDAIVLDVDSPGGNIQGIEEVSRKIFEARGTKPIVAVANHTMASAAYWIASSADQVVVTPSGEVGAIGVFTVHEDMSQALEQDGVKMTIIKAGKYKAEGNPYEPLSEETKAFIQARVTESYDNFVNAVARNRGVLTGIVKDSFGEGRMVGAMQAVSLGMADRIGTLEEAISELLNPQGNAAASAQSEQAPIQADLPTVDQQAAEASAEAGESIPGEIVTVTLENQHLSEEISGEPIEGQSASVDGQAAGAEAGGTQMAQVRQASHARQLELAELSVLEGAQNIMNIRELMASRAAKIARARELANLADTESRDFSETERAEYRACLEEAKTLGEKISTIQTEREALQEAELGLNGLASQAEKPAGESVKSMKRSEFDKLGVYAKASFARSGGKIIDD